MDYWQRVLEEVKQRHNPEVKKCFVHFPELEREGGSSKPTVVTYQYDRKNPKRYDVGPCFPGVYFTAREYECACCYLAWPMYQIVAKKMGLSRRTVECYIASIREKLGQCSREQLLVVLKEQTCFSAEGVGHE